MSQPQRTGPTVQTSDPATFFAQLEERFAQAARVAGTRYRDYLLGETRVRLEFAGEALIAKLGAALAHRRQAAAEGPELTVQVWDSASTGIGMVNSPWAQGAILERGEVAGFNVRGYRTAFSIGSGVLSMLDEKRQRAVLWVRDAGRLAYWESGAPLLTLLHWWFGARGWQLVHGAAVGYPDGGALLAGKGGSGKSTTALACLRSDLAYAGDDYCLLQPGTPPRVHSLYNSAKLNRDNLAFLPFLAPLWKGADGAAEEKALSFVAPVFPERMAAGFPLKAILVPRISGERDTTLAPLSGAAALKALAPSTLFQLSGAGAQAFATMARLVRTVPCFRLNLGRDPDTIPGTIAGLLKAP